ncbi:hypothetical protein [Clostridium guangxiense]|uniref:hypothetical protein n=1 Tax=Clostridium guangxiense TaxID=1662055 RepID=UPI001E4240A3|nr:hypothetical protein [Clostridium guangxiense]MCD2349014.1 hypothetical protein [Clostridium guangxiense]
MKSKIKILCLSLFFGLAVIGTAFKTYAYSGLLDTYKATGVSIVGLWEQDSWTTSGHAYVEHWNDEFQSYEDGTVLALEYHGMFGYSFVKNSEQTATGGGDDLVFSLPQYGTYKFYFKAAHNYNKVDFHGKVWDYR